MKYEVRYGELIQLVSAGNEYQACINCLRKLQSEDRHYSHFEVTELKEGGRRMAIPLSEVVQILITSQKVDDITLGD